MPGRKSSTKRALHEAFREAAAGARTMYEHDGDADVGSSSLRPNLACSGREPTPIRARLDLRRPDGACKDCSQPLLPGRTDAHGTPLCSLCAWCYACRRFDSGAQAPETFAETQTDSFRALSNDTMTRMLDASASEQHQFWTDQIGSKRSCPFGSFSDRASDSLLCSMLAWDPDRTTGLRLASDTRPPFDARARDLFDVRGQALEDYIIANEETEGWDFEDKDSFRVENMFPVDKEFLGCRAAEDYRMKAALAAELARRAVCGQSAVGGVGAGDGCVWWDEDREPAREGGEDAMLADVDGLGCARLRWDGWEDEDEVDDLTMLIDEDYAAEHNYRIY
jgi:hypothetical protein